MFYKFSNIFEIKLQLQLFFLQLPVSLTANLFNFIQFTDTAVRLNEFSQLSTHEELTSILQDVPLATATAANASSALAKANEGFNVIWGERPCFADLFVLLLGSKELIITGADVRKLKRRNIKTIAIQVGNNTNLLEALPFDHFIQVDDVSLLTVALLNSATLSDCIPGHSPISDRYIGAYTETDSISSDGTPTNAVTTDSPITSFATSTTQSTTSSASTEETSSTVSTQDVTQPVTTPVCNQIDFNCANVDRYCVNYESCTECRKCSAPLCSCQSGWRTNVTDVQLSRVLQCSEDIDECEDQPCQHGGICKNLAGSYTCQCPKEFTGSTCAYAVGCAIPDVLKCPEKQHCLLRTVSGGRYGECVCDNGLSVANGCV